MAFGAIEPFLTARRTDGYLSVEYVFTGIRKRQWKGSKVKRLISWGKNLGKTDVPHEEEIVWGWIWFL